MRLRLRLALILVFASCWVLVGTQWGAWERQDGDSLADVQTTVTPQWRREDLSYAYANQFRVQWAYEKDGEYRHTVLAPHPNPDRIRILAIGDSFTFGTGLRDLDRRWYVQLERVLNDAVGADVVEVVGHANADASIFTYADWLLAAQTGTAPWGVAHWPVEAGGFDAVVLGYVVNDRIPGGFDTKVAPAVRAAATAAGWDVPTSGYVDTFDQYHDLIVGPGLGCVGSTSCTYDLDDLRAADPNLGLFHGALRVMRASMPEIPMIVLPLYVTDAEIPGVRAVLPAFEAADWVAADTPALDALWTSTPLGDRMVTPVDMHPGPPALTAYASDAAAALRTVLPTERFEKARASGGARTWPVVSNVIPANASIAVNTASEAMITVDPATIAAVPCRRSWSMSSEVVCVGTTPVFKLATGPDADRGTIEVQPQFYPCQPLGRPFIQVVFGPTTRPVSVRLESAAPAGFELFALNYDERGFESTTSLGTIRGTQSVEVPKGAAGVLIAHDAHRACGVDIVPSLPAVVVHVSQ